MIQKNGQMNPYIPTNRHNTKIRDTRDWFGYSVHFMRWRVAGGYASKYLRVYLIGGKANKSTGSRQARQAIDLLALRQ